MDKEQHLLPLVSIHEIPNIDTYYYEPISNTFMGSPGKGRKVSGIILRNGNYITEMMITTTVYEDCELDNPIKKLYFEFGGEVVNDDYEICVHDTKVDDKIQYITIIKFGKNGTRLLNLTSYSTSYWELRINIEFESCDMEIFDLTFTSMYLIEVTQNSHRFDMILGQNHPHNNAIITSFFVPEKEKNYHTIEAKFGPTKYLIIQFENNFDTENLLQKIEYLSVQNNGFDMFDSHVNLYWTIPDYYWYRYRYDHRPRGTFIIPLCIFQLKQANVSLNNLKLKFAFRKQMNNITIKVASVHN